jgi:hypothetical protein
VSGAYISTILIGCCLLAGAILSWGCLQREGKDQYTKRLRGVDRKVQEIRTKLPTAEDDDVDYYDQSRRDLRELADGLDEVGPPSDVDDAQAVYVRALRGLSRLMGELADCARLEREQRGQGANCRRDVEQSSLDQVTNDLNQADAMYRESGYKH